MPDIPSPDEPRPDADKLPSSLFFAPRTESEKLRLADLMPATDDAPTVISPPRPRAGGSPRFRPDGDVRGRPLGHFELIESVGVGGMAAVLRARDLNLGREVALKILPSESAHDPESIARFRSEARAAAKLDH